MNKKYFFFRLISFTVCIFLFSACPEPKIPVNDITLNTNELTLIPGETATLMAIIYPEDADNREVTWKSSKPAVAKVTNDGLVTAIKDGNAIITVTTKNGRKTAKCSVTVDSDYRTKWVGDWDFEIKRQAWRLDIGVWYDTLYYSGNISLEGVRGNQLNIKYIENITLLMSTDESGKLSRINQTPHEYGYGQLARENKVHVEWGAHYGGGGGDDIIDGIKRKKGGKNE
jgi:hypothetical protein